jgi:hypothetical protein
MPRPQIGFADESANRPGFPGHLEDAAPLTGSWQGAIVAALQRISPPDPGKIRPNPPFTGQ